MLRFSLPPVRLTKRYKNWTRYWYPNFTYGLFDSFITNLRTWSYIKKILPCGFRVTFVCQLTARFLSEAAQNDGGGGQWGKKNQAAADAGLKPQVTVLHLPLRPGRRRWLARSRKYEVRTCLAAGDSCCVPPATHPPNTHFTRFKALSHP